MHGEFKGSLKQHEWLAMIALVASLFLLALLTLFESDPPLNDEEFPSDGQEKILLVWVDGEVETPGTLEMPLGSTIADLFERIQLLPFADTRRFKANTKLKDGRHIHIRRRPTIHVTVSGAISEPKSVELVKGSRISDVIKDLDIYPHADLSSLSLKKKLENGEELVIPFAKNPAGMDN